MSWRWVAWLSNGRARGWGAAGADLDRLIAETPGRYLTAAHVVLVDDELGFPGAPGRTLCSRPHPGGAHGAYVYVVDPHRVFDDVRRCRHCLARLDAANASREELEAAEAILDRIQRRKERKHGQMV